MSSSSIIEVLHLAGQADGVEESDSGNVSNEEEYLDEDNYRSDDICEDYFCSEDKENDFDDREGESDTGSSDSQNGQDGQYGTDSSTTPDTVSEDGHWEDQLEEDEEFQY